MRASFGLARMEFFDWDVRLFADGVADPVVFSTPAAAVILDRLEAHGVPVDRSLTRLWHVTGRQY